MILFTYMYMDITWELFLYLKIILQIHDNIKVFYLYSLYKEME